MASPPYSQSFPTSASPPYPSHASLPSIPKRRPSEMGTTPTAKRRKPSLLTATSATSIHPLRQTSFPPEQAFSARSPSIDTASLIGSSVAGGARKKRPRKSKGTADDAASVAVTAVSGNSRRARGGTVEEEDDGDDGVGLDVAIVARTLEEKEKEKRQIAMLVDAFDEAQYARYERWRAARLAEGTVRRLVNQTLSQSVPQSVVLVVRSVTKIFAGEIIERARKIQTQWLQLENVQQTGLMSPPSSDGEKANQTRRGPLMAEHLREALRRYKLERDGGFVGLMNLGRQQHPTGAERFGLKAMGRRLLK